MLAEETEIEVHAFHKTKPTIKKLMTIKNFKSCQSLKIIFIELIKLILIKVLFNSKSVVSL